MKIKGKILGILALLAGGYLLLLVMVLLSSIATHNGMSKVSSSFFPAALRTQEAEAAFERMKKHYGDAVVLQDAKSLKGAETDADATAAALEGVTASLSSSPELSKRAGDLLAQFNSLRARSHDTYAAILAATGGPSDDLMAQAGALGKDNKTLTDSMSAFDKTIASSFQKQLDTVSTWSLVSGVVGLVLLVVAVLSCAGAWWVIQFKVVVPLGLLALRIQDIAEGEGDLTLRVAVEGRNEIDEVGIWFNTFIARIEDIVRRVTEYATTLGKAASGLAATASETASQTEKQQQQAARITTTMNEMSAAVEDISRNTQKAAVDAQTAEESAKDGGETVRKTVKTIGDLLTSNQETSSRIEELGRSSDAISKVIKVINEIAGQTHLLALNATIEAARAGEHGRGFAVVAGEVRQLAERTRTATKEVNQTVQAIQQGTTDVVKAMRSNMINVKGGVESAQSAGNALVSIIHGSESVQKMVTQIAAAATEQSHSTQSVTASVNEIASIIEQTAAGSQQSVKACDKLATLANELTGLVKAFKVGQVPNGAVA